MLPAVRKAGNCDMWIWGPSLHLYPGVLEVECLWIFRSLSFFDHSHSLCMQIAWGILQEPFQSFTCIFEKRGHGGHVSICTFMCLCVPPSLSLSLCAFAYFHLYSTCRCIGVYSDIVLHIHCTLAASGWCRWTCIFTFAISQAKQHQHHENLNGGFCTKTRCKLCKPFAQVVGCS